MEDVISAICTAAGAAGVGIVRLSGADAINIADKIFSAANGKRLTQAAGGTIHFGHGRRQDFLR